MACPQVVATIGRYRVAVTEGDEGPAEAGPGRQEPADNSLSRLLALSDGVFAIAMTLLALDLKVPDIKTPPTDANLRTQLAHNSGSYWAFLVSFLVVATYWSRHRRLMRSVDATHPALIRDTLILLLLVAAMPFPAALIGSYGSLPFTLVVYGSINAAASITLMALSRDVRRLHVRADTTPDYTHNVEAWANLVIFLLCIPAGYVLGHHGPWVLLLLVIPRLTGRLRGLVPRLRAAV